MVDFSSASSITQDLPKKTGSIPASATAHCETVSSFAVILTYNSWATNGKRKHIHKCQPLEVNRQWRKIFFL